jgi:eukaryotic-like serine/threonine-protein kinase
VSETPEQLYDRALQLPRGERASFVAEACAGDEKLRAELLSLLAAAEEAEGFFAKLGNVLSASPVLSEALGHAITPGTESARSSRPPIELDVLEEGLVIDHYRIVGLLGRGGMGTVYRARDTRLDRDVALKFLFPNVAGNADAEERLLAEARAAAALEHPNICVVHEIGETSNGQPFIAMAFCEGVTLKQRLATGAITPDAAIAIATQVAAALRAAHSRNIIHRDVKPGNIILASDGTAKLLDFGLATSDAAAKSHSGFTPGTVAYMSPEQVRGESVDQRSDLWSLGVVLYEMLAGRRPFRGESERATLRAILLEDAEPLTGVLGEVPAHHAAVVDRLLRKDREERYASADDVFADLAHVISSDADRAASITGRRLSGRGTALLAGVATLLVAVAGYVFWSGYHREASGSVLTAADRAEPSIAVLPLANLGADTADGALAIGMTEELIATLASAGGVRVIASTSTAAFRDRKMDVRRIADSLGVSNILEGGLQKSGSRLRVAVRLVAARDGLTIWSETYERELKDMFSTQEEIARAVAGELGLRFDQDRQLRRHHPRSVAAYELYLRGSDPRLLRSQSGVWKALEYFQRAIVADSDYAAAYAGLALVQVRRGRTTTDPGMPLRELFALAESEGRKAVALDDALPEAHYALSRVLEAELDFPQAEREIRRAIALDPTRSIYHRALCYVLEWRGRPEELMAESERALETDPLNPYALASLGGALAENGRLEEALVQLDRVRAIQPPLQGAAFVTAQIYARQGRSSEAISILRPQAEAGDPMFRALLAYILAKAGQRDEAKLLLADLLARSERTGIGAFQVAMAHEGLGNRDQAFAWLDKSVDDRSIGSVIMAPLFEDLRRDPRFQAIKGRLGLQEQ